ncbi:FliM/FliN family flagellar motor switch protein [bacterium]|nr:FliM/FliN family flagellar motor switch protein [bacterium]
MENILLALEQTKVPVTDNLYEEYDWFKKVFPIAAQKSVDGFFLPGFRIELVGVSKNINLLMQNEPYFVTKIRLDKLYDMFFRISGNAVGMLLEKSLGRPNRAFNINRMTDLEGEILTAFNDYMFRIMAKFMTPKPIVNIKRKNFDMIHLTFIIKHEESGDAGKFIISLPSARLEANKVIVKGDKFEFSDFYQCPIPAKIQVGSTRFTVKEMKNLEAEDIVVFENSRLDTFRFVLKDYEKDFKINPNMGLLHPIEEDQGDNMSENTTNTLWDSIEVDMYAEFDPVKVTLGNLKKIEDGLVVDIAALYDNKITLRVENKVIGHGELVIINDRYGVKITDIVERGQQAVEDMSSMPQQATPMPQAQPQMQQTPSTLKDEPLPAAVDEEDEFDYSDFELEDEDI